MCLGLIILSPANLNMAVAGDHREPRPPYQLASIVMGTNVGTYGVGINSQTNRIYVGEFTSSAVDVIDGRTNKIIDSIPIHSDGPPTNNPTGPGSFAIDQKSNTIYALTNNGDVKVIDGRTDKIIRSFVVDTDTSGFEGFFTPSIVLSERSHRLFVTNGDVSIDMVNPDTGVLLKRIPDDEAGFLTIDETTNTIYESHYWGAEVVAIDGSSGNITSTITGVGQPVIPDDCYLTNTCTDNGSGLDWLVVDPGLHHLYVVGTNDGAFVTIDTRSNKVLRAQTIIGNLFNLAVDRTTHRVYPFSDWGSIMAVVDGHTGSVLADDIAIGPPPTDESLGGFPQGVGFNERTGRLYFAEGGDEIFDPTAQGHLVVFQVGSRDERR